MNYLSVCSGIEAATCAWHPLGWEPFAFSEIEKFPSQVLAHHYPSVPNLGDMTKFEEWPDATIDLLVGGTPCQSFSVAGLRKGLADPRGNLMLTYGAIARRYRPKWLVWENVPGVMSSNGGRDFGTFLGMLGQLGYGVAYRVLDAQYFGVAQRRRRVFVVGHLGDWRRAAAVLFERHSLQGNPAPSREAGEGATAGTLRCTDGGSDVDHARAGHILPITMAHGQGGAEIGFDRGPTLTCNHEAPIAAYPVGVTIHGTDPTVQKVASYDDLAQCLRARTPGNIDNSSTTVVQHPIVVHATQDPCVSTTTAFALGRNNGGENAIAFSCKDHGGDAGPISPTLRSMGHNGSHANAGGQVAVALPFDTTQITSPLNYSKPDYGDPCHPLAAGAHVPAVAHSVRLANTSSNGWGIQEEVTHTLDCTAGPAVQSAMQVRRLTPVECERLQGFPDGYSMIPHHKADGPRYKALGNSMAVPVMAWIGKRIAAVEAIQESQRSAT